MPVTDLITHYIPTVKGAVPRAANNGLWTEEENNTQKEFIPASLESGIVAYCTSP